jgi:hypothetical protein
MRNSYIPSSYHKFFIFVSDPIVERILSFQKLDDGWMYGKGKPTSSKMTEKALNIYRLAKTYGAEDMEAFPIEDGSIMLAVYHTNTMAEIWCSTSGELTIKIEKNDEFIKEIFISSFIELENLLRSFSWHKKSTADLHIHNTIALKNKDMEAQPLENKGMAHPLFQENAQSNGLDVPAYIFKNATKFALQGHQ